MQKTMVGGRGVEEWPAGKIKGYREIKLTKGGRGKEEIRQKR